MSRAPQRNDGDVGPRRLVLIRHAEAMPSSGGGDLGRRLTPRGLETARALGAWLATAGINPDLVLHSPAARTAQTWVAMSRGAREIRADTALYDAGVEHLLETVRAVEPDVATLVLIGHAPAVPQLAQAVGASERGVDGDPLGPGWPAGAAAVVEHQRTWAEFPDAGTGVVAYRTP